MGASEGPTPSRYARYVNESIYHRRLYDWFRRSVPLAPFGELWGPTLDHPANARLRELGREPDESGYHIVRNLLHNVIHAAGAIEHTVEKIEAGLDADQAWLAEHGKDWKPPEGVPTSVTGPHRDEVQYEFSNLLFWIKALQERLMTQVRDDDGAWHDVGLLPALARDTLLTIRVNELYGSLSQVFAERELANFATHASAIPYPFRSSDYANGQVTFRLPDRPTRRIYLWDEFTYEDERDLRSFARSVLRDVERFMDGLLDAFEEADREVRRQRELTSGVDATTT
jgi:hypothetical protein